MNLSKDLFVYTDKLTAEDLYSVSVKLLGAIDVIVSLDVGELISEALPVEVVFLISSSVVLEAVRHQHILHASLFAAHHALGGLLSALVDTEVVLLVDQVSQILV
jgi:hypothetical protein